MKRFNSIKRVKILKIEIKIKTYIGKALFKVLFLNKCLLMF